MSNVILAGSLLWCGMVARSAWWCAPLRRVCAGLGGLLGAPLQWHAVAPPPGAPAAPPRMRHCAHWLPALQPPGGALRVPSAGAPAGPALGDSAALGSATAGGLEGADGGAAAWAWATVDLLVVFGGVTDESRWLTDLQGVIITQSGEAFAAPAQHARRRHVALGTYRRLWEHQPAPPLACMACGGASGKRRVMLLPWCALSLMGW